MNNNLYMPPNVVSNQVPNNQGYTYIPNQNTTNQVPNLIPSQSSSAPVPNLGSQYNYNQNDYAENLLKENIGKTIEVYVSFSDSVEWRDSIFRGKLEDAGRDYLLIYDQTSNKRYLLWNFYLDYIVFEGDVNM